MPEQLEAKITGNGWNLIWESMRPGTLPVEVDVRNRDNLRLTSTDLLRQISRKLSSSKLTPELPGFESEPILTTPKEGKRVPVVSSIQLQFAEGHMVLDAPVITPDSITITGATDALEGITAWPTSSLNLEDVNEDIDQVVGLEPSTEGLVLSRQEVRIQLDVEAFIQETITVPVTVENAPVGQAYEYSPKEVDLILSLPQRAFGSYRAADFLMVADLSGHAIGNSHNTVPLTLVRKPTSVVGARFLPRVVEYYLVE
jgi:YbbR domain-containing protein